MYWDMCVIRVHSSVINEPPGVNWIYMSACSSVSCSGKSFFAGVFLAWKHFTWSWVLLQSHYQFSTWSLCKSAEAWIIQDIVETRMWTVIPSICGVSCRTLWHGICLKNGHLSQAEEHFTPIQDMSKCRRCISTKPFFDRSVCLFCT